MAMAMWAMTTLVAPVMGPLLGGWITDNISWPWIFYINIPVGLVAAAAHLVDLPQARDARPRKRADRRASAWRCWCCGSARCRSCSTRARSSTGSTRRRSSRWPSSRWSASLFFLAWELTEKHPVVDLRLFARPQLLRSARVALSVAYGLFFGNVVLLPLWLQQYMGYTATEAGMVMAPVGLLAIVLSPWSARTSARSTRAATPPSPSSCFALVLWMRSHFNTAGRLQHDPDARRCIQGVAMAFFFIPLQTITLSGLTPDRMPAASGLSNFVRITAGAIGTSISTTLWENRAALHHAQLAEAVNRGNAAADAGAGAAAARRPERRAGAGAGQPAGRPAGLHAGRERHLLPVGAAVPGADRGGLAREAQARRRGRRRRGALTEPPAGGYAADPGGMRARLGAARRWARSASVRAAGRRRSPSSPGSRGRRAGRRVEQLAQAFPVDRAGAGRGCPAPGRRAARAPCSGRPACAPPFAPGSGRRVAGLVQRAAGVKRTSSGAEDAQPRRRRGGSCRRPTARCRRAPQPEGGQRAAVVQVHADPVPADRVGMQQRLAPFVVEPGACRCTSKRAAVAAPACRCTASCGSL